MESRKLERFEARNGESCLKVTLSDGRSVNLHSAYNPSREASQWAENSDLSASSLVLFGLGLGYHLRALYSRTNSESTLFVVEPDPEIREMARVSESLRTLLKQPNIHLISDWDSFKQSFSQNADRWKNVRLLAVPSYTRVYAGEYEVFLSKFKRELNSLLVDRRTVLKSSSVWQQNFLKNLRYLKQTTPVASIFDKFQKKPAIVVSAGPSLSKNIDLLEQARGRALVVAVGTVAKLLLSKNIVPDLIVSFDGWEANYLQHFKTLQAPDIPLIFDPAVHYRIVEEYQGPRVMMLVNPGNLWLEDYLSQKVGQVKIGPSIANTAFDLCVRLGADPVILVGQDLAYTGQRRHVAGTHSSEYDYHVPDEWIRSQPDPETAGEPASDQMSAYWKNSKVVWVDGVEGDKLPTDEKLLTFLHWFEETIRSLKGQRTVVDATEGGALIRGTRIMTLSQALSTYCQEDISEVIAALRDILTQDPAYDMDQFLNYLRSVRARIRRLAERCRKGARYSDQLLSHYTRGTRCNLVKIDRELKRIDKNLLESREFYRPLHYLTSPIVGLIAGSELTREDSEVEMSQQSRFFYTMFLKAFEISMPQLDDLIKALEGGPTPAPEVKSAPALGYSQSSALT